MKFLPFVLGIVVLISGCATSPPPAGTPTNMNAEYEIFVDGQIEDVWRTVAEEFADIGDWSSSVISSECIGDAGGAPICGVRLCKIDSMVFDEVKERVLVFDAENHVLKYQLYEGVPGFVHNFTNTWTMSSLDGGTQVRLESNANATGFGGFVMGGIMRSATNSAIEEMGTQVKYYIENDGQPHPEKVKSIEKHARKAKKSNKHSDSEG